MENYCQEENNKIKILSNKLNNNGLSNMNINISKKLFIHKFIKKNFNKFIN
jgi:hypothetical protein